MSKSDLQNDDGQNEELQLAGSKTATSTFPAEALTRPLELHDPDANAWQICQDVARDGIEESLKRLDRLSVAIRQPKRTTCARDIQKRMGNAKFECFAESLLQGLYPAADDGWKERLLDTIIVRRERIILLRGQERIFEETLQRGGTPENIGPIPTVHLSLLSQTFSPPSITFAASQSTERASPFTEEQSGDSKTASGRASPLVEEISEGNIRCSLQGWPDEIIYEEASDIFTHKRGARYTQMPTLLDASEFSECPICLQQQQSSDLRDETWWK